MGRSLTILTYHRIVPEELALRYPFPSLAIPVEAFRQQVAWLASSCRVLPVGEALEVARSGSRTGEPLVSVTFDDGYADSFHDAAPILEACGVRGTFFATLNPLEQGGLLWFDRAALLWSSAGAEDARRALGDESARDGDGLRDAHADLSSWVELLGRMDERRRAAVLGKLEATTGTIPDEVEAQYRLMTVDQAAELARKKHEVASHTLTHPFLTTLDPTRLMAEIAESRWKLAGWLGRDVDGFCYPAGDHDELTVRAVREAGYRYACTTAEGPNGYGSDPFRLRRYDITSHRVTADGLTHDTLGFRMEVSGLRHRIRRVLGRAP
jgi:peptidoglycan/xylan/chitin deacetylase (PgdA/CDA1 family)